MTWAPEKIPIGRPEKTPRLGDLGAFCSGGGFGVQVLFALLINQSPLISIPAGEGWGQAVLA